MSLLELLPELYLWRVKRSAPHRWKLEHLCGFYFSLLDSNAPSLISTNIIEIGYQYAKFKIAISTRSSK